MPDTPRPSLQGIFEKHEGKVSDKWTSYLDEYQRLFDSLRNQPISLLEIGIQNGGSLEIWAKYFENARRLIGCDINEKCRSLIFDDPRITVFVGDANSDEVQRAITGRCSSFDVVIDDGSHRSGDIVKSFARYFPLVVPGGLFLAEDLHCGYWQEFEGGLFYPFSSIAFFKNLSDIINHEHWGVAEPRSALLEPFCKAYGISFAESDLAQVHAVEFINSMCVVRKKTQDDKGLGARRFSGTSAEVMATQRLGGGSGSMMSVPDQSANIWSQFNNADAKIDDGAVTALNARLGEVARERNQAQEMLAEAKRSILKLEHEMALRESSMSWKLTAPLRALMNAISRK